MYNLLKGCSVDYDVTFKIVEVFQEDGKKIREVELQSIPAHKVVVAAASPVFRAMFFGALKEKDTVSIIDCGVEAFNVMLEFIYTDKVNLTEGSIIEVLYLAKKYDLEGLYDYCVKFITKNLSRQNVVDFYHGLVQLAETELVDKCLSFMDFNGHHIINNNSIAGLLSEELIKMILQRDTFSAREVDIFDAIKWWVEQQTSDRDQVRTKVREFLPFIRFPVMTLKEVVEIVLPKDILTPDEVCQLLKHFKKESKKEKQFKDKEDIKPISMFNATPRMVGIQFSLPIPDTVGDYSFSDDSPRLDHVHVSGFRHIKFSLYNRVFLRGIELANVPSRLCTPDYKTSLRVTDLDLNEVIARTDFIFKREPFQAPRPGKYELLMTNTIELCPKIKYEILLTVDGPISKPEKKDLRKSVKVDGQKDLDIYFLSEKLGNVFVEECKITAVLFTY